MTARGLAFDLRPRQVAVKGRFDVEAATELARSLLQQPFTRVEVDLSKTSEWCIFALVTLVERLRAAGQRVEVISWPLEGLSGSRRRSRSPGPW